MFASCALYLSGSLDESWFDVLQALQSADYVLTSNGGKSIDSMSRRSSGTTGTGALSRSVSSSTTTSPFTSTGGLPSSGAHHPLLTELGPDSVQSAIQRLFDTSKNLAYQKLLRIQRSQKTVALSARRYPLRLGRA